MWKFLNKYIYYLISLIAIIGIADATYLTYEHYSQSLVPCTTTTWLDCGKVLKGPYSEIVGIPVSLFGVLFYVSFFVVFLLDLKLKKFDFVKFYLIVSSLFAFIFSIYLVGLMIFIIGAICVYCALSALTSTSLFLITINHFETERKKLVILSVGIVYRTLLKRIFFLIDAEKVHENMLSFGELSGKFSFVKSFTKWLFTKRIKSVSQKISGINFEYPVGMAAGFDYEAKLTQFLPNLGFGFATVGTITNLPYEGNPKPRLGRLPRSMSLLVNKGFKNEGAEIIAKKLSKLKFVYPQGVSIGRSNSSKLITQSDSIKDITSAFKTFENMRVRNSYYELNISCPNLIHGNVDFYAPQKLEELLSSIDGLKLKKPVFIKMPIEKTNNETLRMLKVIVKHKITGVIFGNLQKDKMHKSLDQEEVKKFKMGYFSGKPTWERSNELIQLAFKNFGKKLVIIGCGGIFSAEDAYKKIKLGASLVQLITGLIYQGPQLVSEINFGLSDLLRKDGFKNISEAVGVDVK